MLEFLEKYPQPVTIVAVPGDASRQFKESSDAARLTSTGLIDWAMEVHKSGYCFDGAIKISDMGIAHVGFILGE